MMRVKAALRMPRDTGHTAQGGFLLGTSLEQYQYFLDQEIVWVAEEDGAIQGFGIVVQDRGVRSSDMWAKKDLVNWAQFPEVNLDALRVAYFEQLACLPGQKARTYARHLALHCLLEAIRHHDLLFTAVVTAPVTNMASLPFLKATGFQRLGSIDEHYPEYGELQSDIYVLLKPQLQALLRGTLGDIARKTIGQDAVDRVV